MSALVKNILGSNPIKDEKKDDDAESDPDLDAMVWSENPEKEYFRSMMEERRSERIANGKQGDDSVVGNETLASLMEEGNEIPYTRRNRSKENMMVGGDDAYRMQIVAYDDDVSMITDNSVSLSRPNSYDSRKGSWKRGLREYHGVSATTVKMATPGRKKKPDGSDDDESNDLPPPPPESPQKNGLSKEINSKDSQGSGTVDSSFDQEYTGLSSRTKKVFIGALLMGAILLTAVIGLAVALSSLRADDDDQQTSQVAVSDNSGNIYPGEDMVSFPPPPPPSPVDGGTPPSAPVPAPTSPGPSPTQPPVTSPTAPPMATPPVGPPADPPAGQQPTGSPTDPPAITPATPTDAPTYEPGGTKENFASLLSGRVFDFPSIMEALTVENSPQRMSFEWLTSDPDYWDYEEQRLIQRYALGVLGLSLMDEAPETNSNNQGGGGQRRVLREQRGNPLEDDWLTYSNECNWFTTREDISICNDNLYTHLELRNLNLFGSIPEELSLLSDSLTVLHLNGNNLQGTIPTALGKLSLLRRISLAANSLSGTIPTEFASLGQLLRIELEQNSLGGTIPPGLGVLYNLLVLQIGENEIGGSIPFELGDLWQLEELSLRDNQLVGEIPVDLRNLDKLERLELDYNRLTGVLDDRICDIRKLDVITADCTLVECDCCTGCGNPDIQIPTSPPTVSPAPSPPPTPCENKVGLGAGGNGAGNDCVIQYNPILINFSNCEPEDDDWLGIYPASQAGDDLGEYMDEPLMWSYLCGTRNCRAEAAGGSIELTEDFLSGSGGAEWPLEPDDYVAVLVRSDYRAYAISETFEIKFNFC